MVANHSEVAGLVPAVDIIDCYALREAGTGTMYDEVKNLFHGFHLFHIDIVLCW